VSLVSSVLLYIPSTTELTRICFRHISGIHTDEVVKTYVGFEVFTAAVMKSSISWDVT
jgi:hypothetical protein